NGVVAMDALQRMILQGSGDHLLLGPAWPTNWNVSFKLQANRHTTVQGIISNGVVKVLQVMPTNRLADIILLNGGGVAPATPTNLTASAGPGCVTLAWNPVPGALSYCLKRGTKSGGSYATIATNFNVTTYLDNPIPAETVFYYVITAINPSGESSDSSEVSASAGAGVPGTPTGLAVQAGNTQIMLSWNPVLGATNYSIQRSTTSGTGFSEIGNRTNAFFTDYAVTNGQIYYYIVTARGTQGTGTPSIEVSGQPVGLLQRYSFNSGIFSNNSVLNLIGAASNECYGVSLGNGNALVTANGYQFGRYPSTNLSYGGSSAYSPGAVFMSGGGATTDANFNTLLSNAELGINHGGIQLSNLVPGVWYRALFLAADTRSGMGNRSFAISTGGFPNSTSSQQSYAFAGGTNGLGGYVLCTFLASNTVCLFSNTQAVYGYQLNAIIVARLSGKTPAFALRKDQPDGTGEWIFTGVGGSAGAGYRLLFSTNFSDWAPIASNFFDANGSCTITSQLNQATPAGYYRLSTP
ncbi:MAG TPA: fibronectin type III domain-containing protein, partial [Verrucomicrobiae bacterium]